MSHHVVLSLFDDAASAANAARQLRDFGVARERVSIVARSHDEQVTLARQSGASPGSELEDSAAAAAEMAALTAAFERLSVDHRHLLVMHHLHRVPVADLARELGIPEGTTKWRLHAARAALARALEADR